MKLFRGSGSYVSSDTAAPLLTDESTTGSRSESSELLHTTLDEVLDGIPVNFFHMRLLALCGLAFMADSMEVSLLSFISICAGSDWDLGNAEIASITGAVFGGQILGSAVWGPVADKFGRRTSFFLAYFLITTAGAASAFAPNLAALVGFRAVVGFGVAGATVPFDLLAEFLSADKRGLAWAILGSMGWRALTLITVLPVLLVSLACAYILPESPRWLINKGRYKDAEEVVKLAAHVNGTPITTAFTFVPSDIRIDGSDKEEGDTEKGFVESLFSMLSPENRMVSISIWCIWLAFGFSYYGIILLVSRIYSNSTDDKSDDVTCSFDYQPIFLNSIAEIVGIFAVTVVINRWGRVTSQVVFYTCTGFSVLLCGLDLSPSAVDVFGGVARACAMGGAAATWVANPELFPTDIRATGHSICNSVARVGALISPYIVMSDLAVSSVGIVLFSTSLFAAFAARMTPETAGNALDAKGVR